MAESNPLLRAALDYAAYGWHVFPLRPRDKTPLTPNGFKAATTDAKIIREWWAKTPDANIGLDCGRSGLVVIDLDKRDDRDGFAGWADLAAQHGWPATTYTSLTGGGGKHLLFKALPGVEVKNSAGKLAPGVDVRAAGGYIVLPPSIHPSGNVYAWENPDALIEPLPDTLFDALITEPDPWKIFGLRDAAQPRPPLVWLVDGILPTNSLSIWYGAPGTLKSMILADLAVCVAGGKRWLAERDGRRGYAVTAGPVLWCDFDNGQRRTHERFNALAVGHKIKPTAPLHYVSMPEPHLDVGDTASAALMAERIVRLNAQLVVIDNLGVIIGNADENSAAMQGPMQGLRWLVEATGTAIVVLHHQRKSSSAPGVTNGRDGDNLRGHGSIEAKLDYAVVVKRDDDALTLVGTKVRGPGLSKLGATFAYENDEAHELTSACFFGYDALAADNEAKGVAVQEEITVILRKTPYLNSNQLYDKIKGNRPQFMDTLRAMKSANIVGERQGPGTSRQLYLVGG